MEDHNQVPGLISLRQFVESIPSANRQFIFLNLPSSRQVYRSNINNIATPGTPDHNELMEACIAPFEDQVYLATTAQEILCSIIVRIRSHHAQHKRVRVTGDPDKIFFYKMNTNEAIFSPVTDDDPKYENWIMDDDYKNLDSIVQYFIDHFQISKDEIPQELSHFRKLLRNPHGSEEVILHHWALWKPEDRKNRIFTLDERMHGVDCQRYIRQLYKSLTPNDKFDFSYYVGGESRVMEVIKQAELVKLGKEKVAKIGNSRKKKKKESGSDIGNFERLFGEIRNFYRHKMVDENGELWTVTRMEAELRCCFPFAIPMLCEALLEHNALNLLWYD